MIRVLKILSIIIASAGWLIPAAAGVHSLLRAVEILEVPGGPIDSFPYSAFARQSLTLSGIWLGIVIVAWCVYCLRARRPS